MANGAECVDFGEVHILMFKKFILSASLVSACIFSSAGAFAQNTPAVINATERASQIAELRQLYSGKPSDWPRPTLQPTAVFAEFGPTPPVPGPAAKEEKVAFGRMLFNDPRISGSGQIACASCHNSELGFGDGIRTSFGHDRQRGIRNAMPLFAAAWMGLSFWDGRARGLEEQALASLINPVEMAADPEVSVARVNADPRYTEIHQRAFGDQKLTPRLMAEAIAAFVRTITPRRSKWDRALSEGSQQLNDQELSGLHLFRTKAGCANCHNGPLFTDQRFHNIGLTYYGRRYEDLGRYAITKDPADVGSFRTASLRGLSRTAPYMHNGLFPHLRGIVNYYNAGGARPARKAGQENDPLFPTTTPILKPLNLSPAERDDLVAFLETL